MAFGRTNVSGGSNKSMIIVTAPTGSTVTCSMGSVNRTALEKDGVWTFRGLDLGTWTIRATLGGESTSKDVTLTRLSIEYVELEYNVYLYNRGDACGEITGGWDSDYTLNTSAAASSTGVLTLNETYMEFSVGSKSGQHGGMGKTANMVDVTKYNTLYFRCAYTEARDSLSAQIGLFSSKRIPPVALVAGTEILTTTEETLYSIDISAIAGSYYAGVYIGWDNPNKIAKSYVTVSEVYMK